MYKIMFFFPSVNLSYVDLIIRTAQEPRREKGSLPPLPLIFFQSRYKEKKTKMSRKRRGNFGNKIAKGR